MSSSLRPVVPERDEARAVPIAAPPSDGPDLRSILEVLSKRRWTIALVALLVVAAVAVRTLRLQKTYSAAVSLVIELQSPKVLGDQMPDIGESAGSFWQSKEFFETQFRILKSHAVAERVVRKLGLDRDASFLGLAAIDDVQQRAAAMAKIDAVAVLRGKTKIDPVRESRVVNVLVEDGDPKRAALVANTLADEFIAFTLEEKRGTSRAASEWLRGQIEQLQARLASSEVALHQFKRENEIFTASLEDSQSIVGRRLSALSDALTKVRERRADVDARVKVVRKARQDGALSALPQVIGSAVVQAHRARALQLGEEKAEAASRYGPEHPKLQAVEERRKAALELAEAEEERIARSVEVELDQVRAAERNLEELLALAKREAFEVNRKEVDFNRLRRDQETSAKVVDLVTKRLKDVDLSSLLRTNNVRVLDSAEVPRKPSSPNLRMSLLLALVAGLVLGVGQAFVREQLDGAVNSQEDVEAAARVAFLGLIPAVKPDDLAQGETPDLHLHRKPKSAAAECCRTVRTNLLFLATEKPLQRLLVTSSGPQEGKTTAVIDLGITFAQSGQRVLLVDTDLRRPRLHRAFGLAADVGLTSVLLDQSILGRAIQATSVPDVSVLPCGPLPPNPAELLHTDTFREVVAELSRRFDRIIFDSPPVGAVTDAQILGTQVDGVVLLAKAGRTSKEGLSRARRALQDVGARVVGAVLNAVDLQDRSAGYHYAYYDRYGGYYGDGDKGERRGGS